MPATDPEDEDHKKRSGSKTSSADHGKAKNTGILGRFKPKRKARVGLNGDVPEQWTVNDLLNEMQMLGLEPSGLGRFILSLHKLAVASGVEPSILASIIKDLSSLSEGKQISIGQVRAKIQQLAAEQKNLSQKVSELQAQKGALETELATRQNEMKTETKASEEFRQYRKQLEAEGISVNDFSLLASMIASARQAGYDAGSIVGILSDIKSKRLEIGTLETELEKLLDSKRNAHQRLSALEQEISEKQETLSAAANLEKLGFMYKDLEDLSASIRMISKTRNIDELSAKKHLVADLQSYYANDRELRARLGTLESLLREKEDKFNLLESDFQNERAVLDNANKLISSGLDEKWLSKLRTIIDSYGTDIDSLAKELQTRDNLNTSIADLRKTRKALEDEERLLRQKVVAAEDQRIKTLALINDMIIHPPKGPAVYEARTNVVKLITPSMDQKNFLNSAQKTIELLRDKLPSDSPARLVLEHALLALRLESTRKD
jgi:DNA repair exonuclease SbcCD ATPase subunit